MKWLLITASHSNPGDQWARMGCEEAIRHVDPDAKFCRVNKHTMAIHRSEPFDRAVVCGMPLAWSHDIDATWHEPWWSAMKRIAKEGPLLVAGAGSWTSWPDVNVTDPARLRKEIDGIGAWGITARDAVFNQITGIDAPVLPCPSVLAVRACKKPAERNLKLCNFMPFAGHFPQFTDSVEISAWRKMRGEISVMLREQGFRAIAHSPDEHELASRLGWEQDEIISYGDFADEFLQHYSRCTHYFGNRVHGAIVSRAFGASVWSVGCDSRQGCLWQLGESIVMPPSSLKERFDDLTEWASRPAMEGPSYLEEAWTSYVELFSRFANLCLPKSNP